MQLKTAIATSNTEIIFNSVIILFIMDLDELLYGILRAASQKWVQKMSFRETGGEAGISQFERSLEQEVQSLKNEIEELRNTVTKLLQKTGSLEDDCL